MDKIIMLWQRIPAKGNILFALLVIIFIWLIAPLIPIGQQHPFASGGARSALMGFAVLIWLIRWAAVKLQAHKAKAIPLFVEHCKKVWKVIKQFFLNFGRHTGRSFKQVKHNIKDKQRQRYLNRQPWYLVVGPQNAGKKTMLANAGLYFIKPEHLGEEAVQYIDQHPDYDWWFTEQAVFINTSLADKEREALAWKKFLRMLRRERKRKPINGIVLNVSLPDILSFTNQERQNFVQQACKFIRNIHETFKAQVPVYLVFTKTDLVEGFMEFFNDLGKEELNQIWGMTFPLKDCADYAVIKNLYEQQYNHLINQLRKRVLWSLDAERRQRGRELIHSFPQQMQLLKNPIATFIGELFGTTRYSKALQLRGLYFVSSLQEGEPHDFLFQVISKKFQLAVPKTERPQRMGECYFLRRLFYDVIFPEAPLLGDSEKSKKRRKRAYRTFCVITPVFLVFMLVGMYKGYRANLVNLQQIDTHISGYQQTINTLKPGDDSLVTLLPLLNELDQAADLYRHKPTWTLSLLYESYAIRRSVEHALQRALHVYFLPRVAAQIEHELNQDIPDQTLLYALLKGYLAFNLYDYTKPEDIKPPMEVRWNKVYLNKPALVSDLKYYINLSLDRPIDKLPLDQQLVNRVRAKLEAVDPADRAYGMLKLRSSVSDLPPLLVQTVVGNNFANVFSYHGKTLTISPLYTYAGFTQVFKPYYESIANEVVEDNKDIGLVALSGKPKSVHQVSAAMHMTYNQQYIDQWQHTLANIKIVKVKNSQQMIALLDLVTSTQSPLSKLLDIVYDNSTDVSGDSIKVDQFYDNINRFSRNHSKINLLSVQNSLKAVRAYLAKIQQSPDPDAAAYQAVKQTLTGKQTPIIKLHELLKDLPSPAKRWVTSLTQQAWGVILMGAHRQLNALWHNEVIKEYNNFIRDRYPLNPRSDNQIAIKDFNHFFASQGTLVTFFNKYLKIFINTKLDHWRQYKVSGFDLGLPPAYIELFQQAKYIRDDYFADGGDKTRLDFSVMPLTLDGNSSSVVMVLGNHYIKYQHGPRHSTSLHWPLAHDNEIARVQITGFNGMQYSHRETGPWALFKLLTVGSFKPLNRGGSYLMSLNLHGHHASFELKGNGESAVFMLRNLEGYSLPQKIAPNRGEE